MKRKAAILAVILIAALLTAPVFATDFDYIGPIDPITGEPAGSSPENPEAERVYVSGSALYDRSAGVFVYPLGTGISEIYSTAADGMIVDTPVSVTASEGITPQVYRNGDPVSDEELTHLNTPGSYVVSAKEGAAAERLLGFTIIGEYTNMTGNYAMPDGFYLSSVTINGEEALLDRFNIDFSAEGSYEIEYSCPAIGKNYSLKLTVDHTAPEFSFDGSFDEDGRAHSAVDVVGLEKTDVVRMTLNGAETQFPSDAHLTASGLYTIEVFDAAGNSTSRQLTILVYFDASSLVFFGLVLVSAAAVVGYILVKRRRLRII